MSNKKTIFNDNKNRHPPHNADRPVYNRRRDRPGKLEQGDKLFQVRHDTNAPNHALPVAYVKKKTPDYKCNLSFLIQRYGFSPTNNSYSRVRSNLVGGAWVVAVCVFQILQVLERSSDVTDVIRISGNKTGKRQ